MDWFRKLPGYRRASPGLEWKLWRKLPGLLAWGTAVPLGCAALLRYTAVGSRLFDTDNGAQAAEYALLGLVAFYWTVVATVAIGCVVVMVMKGPAYAADPFPDEATGDPNRRGEPR